MAQKPSNRFRFFPQLNDLAETNWLKSTNSLYSRQVEEYFSTDKIQDVLLRELAAQRLLPIKEVFESFELFARIRKASRAEVVADLCCGHGLLGILFAMFERKVARVLLIDKDEPESRQRLLEIVGKLAPWATDKIENRSQMITSDDEWIQPGFSIVSSHACGVLSDLCIEIAIKCGGPLAILPCCYPKSACEAPAALQTGLGRLLILTEPTVWNRPAIVFDGRRSRQR